MAYGKKYISEFTSLSEEDYYLEIWEKEWAGDIKNIIGSNVTVLHKWTTDEPKPPIKGSSLEMKIVNDGTLSLSDFISIEDDKYLVKFFWKTQLKFIGYLLQDDFSEIQVDYDHDIALLATDGIGLLKDITLQEAAQLFGDKTEYNTTITRYTNYIFIIQEDASGFPVEPGDSIVINIADPDGVPLNGTYLVATVAYSILGTATYLTVTSIINLPVGVAIDFNGHVILIKPLVLSERTQLSEIVRLCLLSTNIQISTMMYASIIETVSATPRFLEETFINGDNFLEGNNYKSCYDVLVQIFDRFNATLFQADGVWNIVRWDELRRYSNRITGFEYNSAMVYQKNIILINQFAAGRFEDNFLTSAENGLVLSLVRAFKYDKETFNYRKPVNILKNYNLKDLGPLISSETIGDIRTEKFRFPSSSNWQHVYGDDAYIVVVTQIFFYGEIEKERYVYQPRTYRTNPDWTAFSNVQFNDIEVDKGDEFDFECSIKVPSDPGGGVVYRFGFFLQTTTGQYYQLVNAFGTPPNNNQFHWNIFNLTPIQGIGNALQVTSGTAQEYYSFKLSETGAQLKVPAFPANGILRIRIYGTNDTNVSQPNIDAIWKDIKFTISQKINDSTKIIGHTHTDTQQLKPKNNEDVEIFIDDSPRSSINGTLFLSTSTGLLRDRTTAWGYAPGGTKRLGQITTYEQLFWRRVTRSKLEGTLHGLVQPITEQLTTHIGFSLTDPELVSHIYIYDIPAEYFHPGDTIVISGSASNDGSYTIVSVTPGSPVELIVSEPVTLDLSDTATIQIANVPKHLSALTLFTYDYYTGLNFLPGMWSIDYRNNIVSGTLFEMYKDGEADADLREFYEFNYLYDTK